MHEFYHNYAAQLLQNIFEEYKKGNKEKAKEYALELKELNKTIFLEQATI